MIDDFLSLQSLVVQCARHLFHRQPSFQWVTQDLAVVEVGAESGPQVVTLSPRSVAGPCRAGLSQEPTVRHVLDCLIRGKSNRAATCYRCTPSTKTELYASSILNFLLWPLAPCSPAPPLLTPISAKKVGCSAAPRFDRLASAAGLTSPVLLPPSGSCLLETTLTVGCEPLAANLSQLHGLTALIRLFSDLPGTSVASTDMSPAAAVAFPLLQLNSYYLPCSLSCFTLPLLLTPKPASAASRLKSAALSKRRQALVKRTTSQPQKYRSRCFTISAPCRLLYFYHRLSTDSATNHCTVRGRFQSKSPEANPEEAVGVVTLRTTQSTKPQLKSNYEQQKQPRDSSQEPRPSSEDRDQQEPCGTPFLAGSCASPGSARGQPRVAAR